MVVFQICEIRLNSAPSSSRICEILAKKNCEHDQVCQWDQQESKTQKIRTSQGKIRILGFALIDEFPEDFTESDEDRARAGGFMEHTQFHNVKKNIGSIFSEFEDLFKDADGAVRKDLGEPVTLREKHRLTEQIIPRGVEVCAIGVYSKRDNALIAKTAASRGIFFLPGVIHRMLRWVTR